MIVQEIKEELRKFAPEFANRVAPIYKLLNWQWSPGSKAPHVPDAKEIEETLYGCIKGLSEEYVVNGSGGLEAFYQMPSEGESGEYGLRFTLSSMEFFD